MPCCLGLCHDVQHQEEHHHEEGGESSSFGIDGFTINDQINPSYAPDTRLEPIHTDIFLKFTSMKSFKDRTFSVRAIQTIRCNQGARSIVFNGIAFENLQVKQVFGSNEEEEDKNKFSYTYDNQFIELTWNENWSAGQEKKIEFSYTVNQPLSVFFNNPYLPQFGEFAVTDHETERCRHWLACVDFPAIRTTLSFHIETPEETSAFANGSLVSEVVENKVRKVHYELKQRCPSYLICFAIGEFVVVKEQEDYTSINGNKIPLAFIAPKGIKEAELKISFDKTFKILSFLESQLQVPFPFPKYYQVVFPYMPGGAMENISLTTWTMNLLLDETMAKEYRVVFDNVNAHEAAHTYFGDALVIRHFEHVWLKESWATFMAGNFVYHIHGKDEGDYDFINQASRYMSETSSYVRPIVNRIYDHSWSMFDSHTYPGGSWRLNMLMKKLGKQHFWQGITNYINKYMQKCVETEDFRRELEQVSGLNLNKFFDQWIFGRGYPVLKADLKYNAEEKVTVITVEQTQVNKSKGINLFDFDLEIEVSFKQQQGEENSESVKKTSVLLHFSDSKPRAVAIIPTSSKPVMVRFDPDMKVLFDLAEFNPGEDVLLGTLKNAPDVYNRVRAGKFLAKLGTKTAINGIVNTLTASEQFHGVKSLVAKELLNTPNLYSIKAVAKLLTEEKNPMALMVVLNSCTGGPRSEELKQAYLTIINKNQDCKEYGFLTHGRALEAYAHQFSVNGDNVAESIAAIDLIVKNIEADNRSISPLVKRAGYRALGSFKGPSAVAKHAYEILMSKLKSERAECTSCIISSLASLANSNGTLTDFEKDIVVNTCLEYMKSDDVAVVKSAIGGLVSNKAKKALKAIVASKSQFAAQDLPWLNRKIEALTRADNGKKPDVAKLQKEVEDLKNQVKQVQNKFDDYVELQKVKQNNNKQAETKQ